ncbi:MAG: transporter, partial [bacterium]|nr:transporter [bacterium]
MRTLEIRLFILTVVSWFLITPTPDGVCRDYRYGLGTGLSYTSGDYGFKDDEELFYIPLIFNAYLSDRFRGTVVLPWVHQSSTKLISAGGSFYRITGRNIREVGGSRSGLGDLLLLGEYDALIETRDRPAVVMGGKLKLPTASEDKGLGTGEVDVGATVEVGKTVHQLYYYGRLGYTFIGEPSRADFDDPFLYEAGIGYEVNRDFFLTFAVVGETSIDDNV